MKKLRFIIIGLVTIAVGATAMSAAPSAQAAAEQGKTRVGIVNFRQCVEQSKIGQKEQELFDSMRKQLEATVQEKEKKLGELTKKFSDPNYVDSLSHDAEAAAKKEYQELSQEMAQMQNQYYQMLNQANVKIIQKLAETISEAAKQVAKERNLELVLNEDSAFYFDQSLSLTPDVVKAMDAIFAARKDELTIPKVDEPAAKPALKAPTK